MKRQVSFSRKVCTAREYENMSIGYQLEFDDTEMSVDNAFALCRKVVEDQMKQVLYEMEVKGCR